MAAVNANNKQRECVNTQSHTYTQTTWMHRAFRFICSHLVWLWVNPPFIFSFYPPPCLSLSVPFPPFIGKTVCERSIKGTRVSCILMKWDMKYKWTGHRQRQKENETRRWKVTDEEEEWQRSLMFGGDSFFIKPKGDIKSFSDMFAFFLPTVPH